ncbi:hypothetical protein PV326_005649 [Microctonus aethiopoides]|nr:hypothetical protein PV326_005649 [Microctonus aethiopoides]
MVNAKPKLRTPMTFGEGKHIPIVGLPRSFLYPRHCGAANKFEQWTNEKGNETNNQLRNLGANFDWSKEYFPMSENYKNGVIEAFIMLYEHDSLYSNNDLLNRSPTLENTVSDIKVDFIEVKF